MFQNLYPSEDYDSAYQIDYEGFYDKGYRGILFDVDNTLVEHDQPVTLPAIELFENLKEMGFKTCIISNNKDYRVKPLADALESEYVYKAGKPSKAGYEKGMEIMGTNRTSCWFIKKVAKTPKSSCLHRSSDFHLRAATSSRSYLNLTLRVQLRERI